MRRGRPRPVHLLVAQRRHPQHPQLSRRTSTTPSRSPSKRTTASTETILEAAQNVIAPNRQRLEAEPLHQLGQGRPHHRARELRRERRGAVRHQRDREPQTRWPPALRLRRHVPRQRAVPRPRRDVLALRRAIPPRGQRSVLPAPGDKGPRLLSPPHRQPQRRRELQAHRERPHARHRSAHHERIDSPRMGPRNFPVQRNRRDRRDVGASGELRRPPACEIHQGRYRTSRP